jgi:AcrR family transcriptional regulator
VSAQPQQQDSGMSKKAPRRTAERILETALTMFNRFGEPNVSTTAISADMGISLSLIHI